MDDKKLNEGKLEDNDLGKVSGGTGSTARSKFSSGYQYELFDKTSDVKYIKNLGDPITIFREGPYPTYNDVSVSGFVCNRRANYDKSSGKFYDVYQIGLNFNTNPDKIKPERQDFYSRKKIIS